MKNMKIRLHACLLGLLLTILPQIILANVRLNALFADHMVDKKELLNETVPQNTPLKRFQIVGEDRKWKWANAEIVANNKIVVSHPEVPEPTVVRYAWSDNPEGANLYNKEGLPASIFTTEE